jgi:uncharacterized protein YecA (UPF0149 family)
MDTKTGEIVDYKQLKKNFKVIPQHFKPMKISPTSKQLKSHRINRNDPCPCGSGKKFKKCCLNTL